VQRLGLAWSYDFEMNRGAEATPLVVDGVMYVTSAWSIVHAIDARTGTRLWVHDPKVDARSHCG
jgi:quinohemoprotein ethanol dehydrogenase